MALTKTGTDGIKDDAITTAKIADNAVTFQQLASNTVKTGNIEGNAVTTERIADEAVTLAKLEHGTSSNDGKFLRANNGADPSFETVTSTTINNNSDNKVITGSNNANTLDAESSLIYNGSQLLVNTSTPAAFSSRKLTVSDVTSGGTSAIEIRSATDGSGRLYFTDSTSSGNAGAYAGKVFYDHTDDHMGFFTGGSTSTPSEKLQILANGNLNVVDGNLSFASGHGIDFSATANGGTGTPNELFDDYEEGSWTPVLEGLSNTPSFHNLGGNYTKIGNRVFLQGHIQVNVKPQFSNQSSVFKLSGLPFTGDNSGAGGGYFGAHGVCVWQQLQWVGASYSSYGASNDTQLSPGIVDSGTRISFQTCGQAVYYTGQMLNRAVHNNYAWNIEFDMQYRTAT